MEGLFISDTDVLNVSVYIATDKGKVFVDQDKAKLLEQGLKPSCMKEFTFTFRKPSYKDEVDILSNIVSSDGESLNFDPAAVRYVRFKTLIKDWDLTDNKGNKVPVTPENVGRLSPVVAGGVLDILDGFVSG